MEVGAGNQTGLQPAAFCEYLLNAMEESEARRKRRKRDTGPDIIGMDVKRDLLRKAVADRPTQSEFEQWLMEQVMAADAGGPVRAMALEILADYRNACAHTSFSEWLEAGAQPPAAFKPARGRRR